MTMITRFEARNVLGIKAIDITPDGWIVEICGPNGQGKSSALKGIMMALAGKSHFDELPIRHGENKLEIALHLDDGITIEYEMNKKTGRSKISVIDEFGDKIKSPQAFLNKYFNAVTFRPLEFVDADKSKQTKMLLDIVQLPFDAEKIEQVSGLKPSGTKPVIETLQGMEGVLTERRKDAKKEASRLKQVFQSSSIVPDEYKDAVKVSVSDLLEKRNKVSSLIGIVSDCNVLVNQDRDTLFDLSARKEKLIREIESVDEEISRVKQSREEMKLHLNNAMTDRDKERSLEAIDTDIANAETVNKWVDQKATTAKSSDAYDAAVCVVIALDDQVEGVREYRKELLANAAFPVEGLGFDEDGCVTLNDTPISQLSMSESVIVGMAICAALKPKLRIMLIDNAECMDKQTKEKVYAWTKKNGFQLWLFFVKDAPDGVGFFITDGEIV